MVLKACSLLKETDDHKGDTSVVTPEEVARDLCGKWEFFLVSQALLILRVCFCLLPDVTCLPDTPYPDSLLELRLPWKRHRKVSCFG